MNATENDERFALPSCSCFGRWSVLVDTARPDEAERTRLLERECDIEALSLMLLALEPAENGA
jgi:hypothetical protein